MIIFRYDKSFDGLLTCVFEAYALKTFPDVLLPANAPLPLFYDRVVEVRTDETRSSRVWRALGKKLSRRGLSVLTGVWLSELPDGDLLLFRYIRKAIDSPQSIEMNFGDNDVLQATQISKKVSRESHRIIQFIRFQKISDGTFFAAIEPLYNVLPVTLSHFRDRFADQPWIIYDLKRGYGYHYDLKTVTEIKFSERPPQWATGQADSPLTDKEEQLFQQLWQQYFKSIAIQERINPKLHRQNLPRRFWKYLTEKK